MMFDRAKGFIALPGGIGTMEELTEIMTWLKLDLHTKPIGLLNIDGYYDHFIKWVSMRIQWNGSILDTLGTAQSVLTKGGVLYTM